MDNSDIEKLRKVIEENERQKATTANTTSYGLNQVCPTCHTCPTCGRKESTYPGYYNPYTTFTAHTTTNL